MPAMTTTTKHANKTKILSVYKLLAKRVMICSGKKNPDKATNDNPSSFKTMFHLQTPRSLKTSLTSWPF